MTSLNDVHPGTAAGYLAALRTGIRGAVITPADPGYDAARQVFFGGYDRRPAVVVRPVDTADVSAAVTVAARAGLPTAVRSGGHSLFGVWDGALVIDLSAMRGLEIDPERRVAAAGPGVTAAEYTAAAAAYGLATGFGDTGSVGLGGLVTGGGIGYLTRRFGLTVDDLLLAEVVTADGSIRRVDAVTEPDLFWAIRGGGGNFGVVTRFELRLHEVPRLYAGHLVLPPAADTLAAFLRAAERAPDTVSSIVNVMPAPPLPFVPVDRHGELVIMAMLVHAGAPEDGPAAMAPFRELAEPIADTIGPMPTSALYPPEDGSYHPRTFSRTSFVDTMDMADCEQIIEFLRGSTAPVPVAQIRALGGAMARIPADATAFAHRRSRFMATAAVVFDEPAQADVHRAWVEEFGAALRARSSGAYVNFLYDDGAERIGDAYPATVRGRLAGIKRRYDPTNLFRLNVNIVPA